MLIQFMAQESVWYLQIQYNTTNFYENIWYFSLNFFITTFLAAMSLHRVSVNPSFGQAKFG
jgi:hypothetical protein